MSLSIDVRDAIVELLEDSLSSGSTEIVNGAILPRRDMASLGTDTYIDVVPALLTQLDSSRGKIKYQVVTNVIILKKVIDEEEESEELLTLVESKALLLTGARLNLSSDSYISVSDIKYLPLFDKGELDQNKIFAANISTTVNVLINRS
jgi:hypothetical protein